MALKSALETIRRLPPLVHQNEVDQLRQQLAEVAQGKRFLLQGGDCAERFQDCTREPIEAKLKIMLQISLILTWGGKIPTVRVGRVAGQYGKPRSSPTEKSADGTEIPSFKGDNINGFDANPSSRTHDPLRLVAGHFHSAATINYIRALIRGGLGDLHQSSHWDLGGVRDDWKRRRYEEIAAGIVEALEFMEIAGVPASTDRATKEVDFFTSHEGLILDYESAVTYHIPTSSSSNATFSTLYPPSAPSPSSSPASSSSLSSSSSSSSSSSFSSNTVSVGGKYYNLGAHFLWIGNRTRSINDAHIEYFRGIENPIGIKVDAETQVDELISLIRALDPLNRAGKITLISRIGYEKVWLALPRLIRGVRADKRLVVWSCDPMHGNTYTTEQGIKTRNFDHILAELTATFQVHQSLGSRLGGVHFELTGEDVTECIGGPQQLAESNLRLRYTTYCDPRLNYLQSMEVAFLLADLLRSKGRYSLSNTAADSDSAKPVKQLSCMRESPPPPATQDGAAIAAAVIALAPPSASPSSETCFSSRS